MGDFRTKIREARRSLHSYMSEAAIAYMPVTAPATPTLINVTVRIHEKFQALGDLKGTSFHYAEVEDNTPRIVFLRSEITPQRNMIVSVEAGRAYRVDHVLPPDDITVTAKIVRLRAEDTVGLPVPT